MRGRQFNDPTGITEESSMLRKSTLLAVAASAALGLAMLAPTSASAHGGHGGGWPRWWRNARRRRNARRWPSAVVTLAVTSAAGTSTRTGTCAGTARSGTRGRSCTALHRAAPCRAGPLHLPEQGIHPGRRGAVQGSLHQRGGDESSGAGAAADRPARAAASRRVRARSTAAAGDHGPSKRSRQCVELRTPASRRGSCFIGDGPRARPSARRRRSMSRDAGHAPGCAGSRRA